MKLAMRHRLNKEAEAGISTSIEAVLSFASWARGQGGHLTPEAIKARFGCSRATSYRWFNAYRAARERMVA